MPFEPDIAHLILAARASYDIDARPALRVAASDIDWTRWSVLAGRHRLEGLVWLGLVQAGIEVPSAAAEQMRARAKMVAARQLASSDAGARIANSFCAAGIDLLFLKGFTLATLAYPHPHAKDSCDVDVLVHKADLGRAARMLAELGFRPALPANLQAVEPWHRQHKESVWLHESTGVQIDLHTRVADNPGLIPSIGMASPRQSVMVGNSGFESFDDATLYAYLCVHGCSSAWFRLKWLTDLHAFLLMKGDANIGTWHDEAVALGAGRASSLALRLLRRWFGFEHPPFGMQVGWAVRGMEAMAHRQILAPAEPTRRRLGTLTIHATQLLQKPGLRYAINEAARQVREMARR